MARMRLDVNLQSQGASLRTIGRELRDMDERKVTELFRSRMLPATRPYVRAVVASIAAIPTTGKKHTGLRARIAACTETASWGRGREVNVAIEVNGSRMPDHEKGLPLYMEGLHTSGPIDHARWRHPVFGRSDDPWEQQPAHPYFFQAASGYGRAAGDALKAALDDITRKING